MRHEWLLVTADDLRFERQQLRDEGRDIAPLADTFDELIDVVDRESGETVPVEDRVDVVDSVGATDAAVAQRDRVNMLLNRARDLPVRDDYPYSEPNDRAAVRTARPASGATPVSLPDDERLRDHVLGAWLGRCAGCLLGKPVEGWTREKLEAVLRHAGAFPLDGYVEQSFTAPPAYDIDRGGVFRSALEPGQAGMPEDDDLNYTVVGLDLMTTTGCDFESEDVARYWLRNVPVLRTHTAERVAYRNLTDLVGPPESGRHRNPYREWIGAMIRADPYGYVALGDPSLAATLAWRDARVSHVKNGIYAAMWVAAMLAAAPAVDDVTELVGVGLAEVPANSRLYEAIGTVVDWRADGVGYWSALDRLHDQWDQTFYHDWCHAVPNAQVVTLGLLWGGSRFSRSVCRTVQAGFDTDSNGATVGSLVGMLVGAAGVGDQWLEPIDDTLETGIDGYHRTAVSDLAETTVELVGE